jgi:hypothetical protein
MFLLFQADTLDLVNKADFAIISLTDAELEYLQFFLKADIIANLCGENANGD